MLMLDSDELLMCLGSAALSFDSLSELGNHQQRALDFLAGPRKGKEGADELLFRRPTYFGRYGAAAEVSGEVDLSQLNNETMRCMSRGFERQSAGAMLSCWGQANYANKWMKSSDVAGKCPFHFAHWSCSPPSDKAEHK